MSRKTSQPFSLARLAPWAIILATAIVYTPAVPGPYLWDDHSLIADNPTLDEAGNIPRYFLEDLGTFNQNPRRMGYYRPLQPLTFHLEVALFGRSAPLQRCTNILLHALAALALFGLASTLLPTRGWALAAALLFAVHPLCSEEVCLIANRGGMLAGALSLGTLYFLSRAFADPGKTDGKWLALAGLAYSAALLSKLTALVLIAPALAWLWLKKEPAGRRQFLQTFILIGGLALAYMAWRWGYLGISHAEKAVDIPFHIRLLAMPRLGLFVLGLTLAPLQLHAIREPDLFAWVGPWPTGISSLVWLLLLVITWRLRKHQPLFLFTVLFFSAFFSPTAGLVPLVRPVAEHYYYLPTAGVCLAAAGLFASVPRKKIAQTLAVAVALTLATGTVYRAIVWSSPEYLWLDNIAKDPGVAEGYNNLGALYAEWNSPAEAYIYIDRALQLNPADEKTRLNHARLATDLNRFPEALTDFRTLLQKEPCPEKALFHLGRLAARTNNPDIETLYRPYSEQPECARFFYWGRQYEKSQLQATGDSEAGTSPGKPNTQVK